MIIMPVITIITLILLLQVPMMHSMLVKVVARTIAVVVVKAVACKTVVPQQFL
ncbi:MAG: hypothetical protein WD572_12425 [Gammaproteobacteria bacterium]